MYNEKLETNFCIKILNLRFWMKIYIKETNRVNESLELEWKFREFRFKINFREWMKIYRVHLD